MTYFSLAELANSPTLRWGYAVQSAWVYASPLVGLFIRFSRFDSQPIPYCQGSSGDLHIDYGLLVSNAEGSRWLRKIRESVRIGKAGYQPPPLRS